MAQTYIHSSIPSYYPGTDVLLGYDIDVRIHARGDDRRYWEVQFCGHDNRWYAVPDPLHVLVLVEKHDPRVWGELMRAA